MTARAVTLTKQRGARASRHRARRAVWIAFGAVAMVGACRDSPSEPGVGPPARIAVVSGDGQTALPGMELSQPIRVSVTDAKGRAIPGVAVGFTVSGGGALLGAMTVVSDDAGEAAAPRWRLGKSVTEQTMHVSAQGISTEVSAVVQSGFHVVFRFFGNETITAADQKAFANAVARVRGIITGDLPAVNAVNSGIDLAQCGVTGQPRLSEVIDDVLIFAAIQNIDGPAGILARAGPCLVRTGATPMTVVGIMWFDASDIATFLQGTAFEEVITHEIIHVLGFGTLWEDRGFLTGAGTADPRYTGVQAHHECLATNWSLACSATLPVEAGGGPGMALGHWRETTFGDELLTGYYSSGNVLSEMTVGALADLGFLVNTAAADDPMAAVAAARVPAVGVDAGWERLQRPVAFVTPDGRVQRRR